MSGDAEHQNRCALCSRTFRQKSSLVRHAKKCTLEPKPSVRQKACRACTAAKARCDLVRPACSRCLFRGAACAYIRHPHSPPTVDPAGGLGLPGNHQQSSVFEPPSTAPGISSTSSLYHVDSTGATTLDFADLDVDGDLTPGFFSSSEDGIDIPAFLNQGLGAVDLELLHTTPNQEPSPPSHETLDHWMSQAVLGPQSQDRDVVLKHSMRTIFRVLRSWPRMVAKGLQLPPIIHFLQFEDGTPRPLANCITICKMWSGQCDDSSRPIVEDAVQKEVDIILGKYRTYDQATLLASLQSIVIYLLLLIFPTPLQTSQSLISPGLFVQIQTMGHYVASTGLTLHEESTNSRPVWAIWSLIEAKRRAMCSLYLVHWAYSIYHSQVRFDCGRDLARMPGPGAKFLWNASNEQSWNALYERWLEQWDEGRDFMFAEFMGIDPEVVMNRRAEIWLEDADELGFLMLSLVNVTERNTSRVTAGE